MQRWSQWLAQHRGELEAASPWQWLFARTVLARVRGLDPEWVTVEHPFKDGQGRARRVDFAIQTPAGLRLAIEVDGYDKQQRGAGMNQVEFRDFLSRQNSLVNQGWHLLRFANTAVRDNPDDCRDQVQAALVQEPPTPHDTEPHRSGDGPRASAWLLAAGAAAVVVALVAGWLLTSRTPDEAPPRADGSCPSDFKYKANDESLIFHAPGQRYYEDTDAERCFATPQAAEAAGFRAAKV